MNDLVLTTLGFETVVEMFRAWCQRMAQVLLSHAVITFMKQLQATIEQHRLHLVYNM
jgi:hypothetical protein